MSNYPNISRVIIDNFIEVINRIPMKSGDRERILKLLRLSIDKLGETITADAIYPTGDSNPDDYYEYESDDIYNEEI